MAEILIIEDDRAIQNLLKTYSYFLCPLFFRHTYHSACLLNKKNGSVKLSLNDLF